MRLRDLQDRLRTHIRGRIGRGELTGSGLSQQAGFQQGHLSNFLNARRGLSLELMDRLLKALEIEILDLAEAGEIEQRVLRPATAGWQSVAIVSAEDAARLPRFTPAQVTGTLSFRKTFLRRLRANDVCHRGDWLRFVALEMEPRAARGLFSRSAGVAMLLIDRHYTSLVPYRQQQPNLYAVRFQARCAVGYVTQAGEHLVLRSRDPQVPVELARIDRSRGYSDQVVGRVCHVAVEV